MANYVYTMNRVGKIVPPKRQILKDISLSFFPGAKIGVLGLNGSGKSTMINVVSGHYVATAGRIEFAGHNLVGMEAHRVARLGISRTYQIPRPFAQLSVLDNVTLSAMFGHAGLGRAAAEQQAQRCMAFTGLQSKAKVLPDELNLHQRKFLEFARALAARCCLPPCRSPRLPLPTR